MRDRSFRLPQSSPARAPTLLITLVVLALILVALDYAGMLGPLRSQASSLVNPAMTLMHRAGMSIGGLVDARSASQESGELAQLREEVSRLREANLHTQQLELELARLRQQVRIEAEQPWKLVGGDISAFSPDSGRRVVVLAVGSDAGVHPGMAVIAKEGANPPSLIGVVEEVGSRSASVLLITDFSSAVSARIYRSDRSIDGLVQGQWQRGSRLTLEEVEREEQLAEGDVVVTAGLSKTFQADLPHASIPPNVPIGMIDSVTVEEGKPVADVRPYVDPDRVRYAWVILNADG
jgi:rod shape-determining protein MreC